MQEGGMEPGMLNLISNKDPVIAGNLGPQEQNWVQEISLNIEWDQTKPYPVAVDIPINTAGPLMATTKL